LNAQPTAVVAKALITALSDVWDFKTLFDASKTTNGSLKDQLLAASEAVIMDRLQAGDIGTIQKFGIDAEPYIMAFAKDDKQDTDARKRALWLLGNMGNYNDVSGYLISVILYDSSYQWWHKWEAREGFAYLVLGQPEAVLADAAKFSDVLKILVGNVKGEINNYKNGMARSAQALGKVGDQTVMADLDRISKATTDAVVRAAVVQAIEDIKKRLGLKSANVDNAASRTNDKAMGVFFSDFSWLSGIFSKASLKNVKEAVPLAFASSKTWTRRDFLRGLGAAAALTLVLGVGCTKDESDETLLESLQRLTMSDPMEAVSSSAYKNILKMGPGIWADLKLFASDGSRQTDARKWALRLIGEVAAIDNQDAVNYLNSVINDATGLYEWWHKEEARNGLNIFYARKGKATTTAMGVVGAGIDAAMEPSDLGGIDMNDIGISRNGAGSNVQFDAAKMEQILNMKIEGFVPVVVSLTPVDSVLLLLK
jgi:hypothetical protein